MIDFRKIEKKWQKKWDQKKLFQAEPDKRKKFFTSNVIPYVNGDAHIGHSFTFTRTDAYARFKRMQGYNVLLAQGFHATGEPIVGIVERLKKGDKSQTETFKLYGATDRDIENFKKKGPKFVAEFWSKKMEESFRMAGYSIDWRRAFTLSVDPCFSKFVEWQYNTLRRKGYVVQGTHPVVWCPHDQSPTGDHDRLEGEGESPVEYTLIKFPFGDAFLPAATLRPETIYGVTNIWLNPHADYVKIEVADEKWIVAKESVVKINDQFKDVREIKEYDERIDLFGRRAKNPVSGRDVPIIPSEFVDPGSATGVVMSVPAHAPYDYIALKEFQESGEAERFGLTAEEMKPISLVNTELGGIPAKTVCDEMKITTVRQEKELDEATNLVYRKEFHTGILNENCGPYKGMKVSEVKDKIVMDFIEKDISDVFYDVDGVVCRCTTKCHVKILENQWFLKYSDVEWKEKVRKCLAGMKIYPEEARNNFSATINWMKDKACTRRSGLGTQLPWDKDWIVETLSDSTIYMAYYTISHLVKKYKIPPDRLTDDVFDYVLLGKGVPGKIARSSKINVTALKPMRTEFDYFYPMDMRNSGKDLVQHHLTFYMYQHTALWQESKWPKGISVNGFVNVEGAKMSKSKGNIIPLRRLVEEHGADLVRINIATSSEGIEDADWRTEGIKGFRQRLELLHGLVKDLKNLEKKKTGLSETYLMSRLNIIVKNVTEQYETLKFRTGINHGLFEAVNEIKWYLLRTNNNPDRETMKNALSITIRLIAPFTPHICEEMWSLLGNKTFVSFAEFPKYNEKLANADVEKGESFVKQTLEDVREIQKITSMTPKKVVLFVAEEWKFSIYSTVLKNKERSSTDVMREVMATDMKKYGSATVGFIQNLYRKITELQAIISKESQIAALIDAKSFLEKEIGCRIEIIDSENSQEKKARSSSPNKLGILLE